MDYSKLLNIINYKEKVRIYIEYSFYFWYRKFQNINKYKNQIKKFKNAININILNFIKLLIFYFF